MSTAAIMMVKDEADILPDTLTHLARHVDEIYVYDNGSTDGTSEFLDTEWGVPLHVEEDAEVGYWQSNKMTMLARKAAAAGHQWVIPCDADEIWYVCADPDRRIADYLAGQGLDVQVVQANLYNHLPTSEDDPKQVSPVERLKWRQKVEGSLPKVACRPAEDLSIGAGNHTATYEGHTLRVGGLCIRHFTWRSPEQYVRKIRNGIVAYAATDLPEEVGGHWRMWQEAYLTSFATMAQIADHSKKLSADAAVADHFRRWFFEEDPWSNDELILDPCPWQGPVT